MSEQYGRRSQDLIDWRKRYLADELGVSEVVGDLRRDRYDYAS